MFKQVKPISVWPIGYVSNQFETPIDPGPIRETESTIILDHQFIDGLRSLKVGDKLMVVFYFHLIGKDELELLQYPRGDRSQPQRGVFTLRSPNRPNPIGVTEVEVLSINENEIRVKGLDALNNTPILDLKTI